MDVYIALLYILLGCILGIVGQGARVIIGLKKHYEKEEPEKRKRMEALRKREEALDERLKTETDNKEIIIREKELLIKEKEMLTWFSWNQLITSLLIAIVVGGVAGVTGFLWLCDDYTINKEFMVMIIGIGYAGTDFIEGFMNSRRK